MRKTLLWLLWEDSFSVFHGGIEAEITSPNGASDDNSSEIAGVLPNSILSQALSKLKKYAPKSYQCNQDSSRAISPNLVIISPSPHCVLTSPSIWVAERALSSWSHLSPSPASHPKRAPLGAPQSLSAFCLYKWILFFVHPNWNLQSKGGR